MTAVEWLYETLWKQTDFSLPNNIFEHAKEMEKQQIVEAGNSCAIKQHLHNDMIDKMSNAEAMAFTQTDNLTFGEEYYNEKFYPNQSVIIVFGKKN
jgi:hypothetical protein